MGRNWEKCSREKAAYLQAWLPHAYNTMYANNTWYFSKKVEEKEVMNIVKIEVNGITLEGPLEKVKEIARKVGFTEYDYYFSDSKKTFIKYSEMPIAHAKNSFKKLCKSKYGFDLTSVLSTDLTLARLFNHIVKPD